MSRRKEPIWIQRLGFVLIAVAGVAVVASALWSAAGDLFAEIVVRGGTFPSGVIVLFGVLLTTGGVVGYLKSRD